MDLFEASSCLEGFKHRECLDSKSEGKRQPGWLHSGVGLHLKITFR
jgi:hypothetical protein